MNALIDCPAYIMFASRGLEFGGRPAFSRDGMLLLIRIETINVLFP